MVKDTVHTLMEGPFGPVRLAWCEDGLVAVMLGKELSTRAPAPSWHFDRDLRCEATEQLQAYFEGRLTRFDLPLVLDGTPFQKRVWLALGDIPMGETISYSALASRIGAPKAVRAVGSANGRNPLPIVLPCHRVIGRDGALRGYAGGVETKAALLEFERRVADPSPI